MNNARKINTKKSLVRNTELPVPKTVVTLKAKKPLNSQTTAKEIPKKSHEAAVETFESPELYTMLKLSEKIDEIANKPCKSKTTLDLDRKKKLAIDEKITRNVNFPFDQPIYKNLIPLASNVNQLNQQQSTSSTRIPLTQKDAEPNLVDFLKPRNTALTYYYQPTPSRKDSNIIPVQQSNLRLYKVLQMHDELS